jgi:hypothetical protein
MPEYGFHAGPTAPSSLNGANNGEVEIKGGGFVKIQAALFTNPTAILHWRVAYASGLTATALDTAEGFLSHGGSEQIDLGPHATAYIYWFLTDAAGTALAGGANDRLNKWVQRR